MKDPRHEAEDMRQARGEYDEDFGERQIDEFAENLMMIAVAAEKTRLGDMTFMEALRRGGCFSKRPN